MQKLGDMKYEKRKHYVGKNGNHDVCVCDVRVWDDEF